MSAFFILVAAVGIIAAALGFYRGLLAQVGQILGLVGAVMACRILGPVVASWLNGAEPDTAADIAIGYAITFIVVYFAIVIIFRLVRGVVHGVHLGCLDRVAGAVFKAGVWMLILSVLLNVWAVLAPGNDLTDTAAHPKRAYVMRIAPALCGYVMQKHAQNSDPA